MIGTNIHRPNAWEGEYPGSKATVSQERGKIADGNRSRKKDTYDMVRRPRKSQYTTVHGGRKELYAISTASSHIQMGQRTPIVARRGTV